jgi:hypothetical protein
MYMGGVAECNHEYHLAGSALYDLDLAYGDAPRERLDLFLAADPKAPTLRSEAAPGCFEVVVVEAAATGRAKISISAAHVDTLGAYGMLPFLK